MPDDPLTALTRLAAARSSLDREERDLIASARADGVSWAEIATALGLRSRQAAEQRWLRLSTSPRRDPSDARRQRSVDNAPPAAPATVNSSATPDGATSSTATPGSGASSGVTPGGATSSTATPGGGANSSATRGGAAHGGSAHSGNTSGSTAHGGSTSGGATRGSSVSGRVLDGASGDGSAGVLMQLRAAIADTLAVLGDDWDGLAPRSALVRATLAACPEAEADGAVFALCGHALSDLDTFAVPRAPAARARALRRLRQAYSAAMPR